jgi:hypothetical protein
MAYILHAYIVDPGDRTIKVGHEFYGHSEAEVETYFKEHIRSCEYFANAVKADRVIEELERVPPDELPRVEDFEVIEEVEEEEVDG